MALLQVKAMLTAILLVAAFTALLSMLSLMGRKEHRVSPRALRLMHRVSGYVFVATALVLGVVGVRLLSMSGDGLPFRAVLHWTGAVVLIILLGVKLALARRYRQLLTFVPPLGLAVFALALLVAAVSLGFSIVAGG